MRITWTRRLSGRDSPNRLVLSRITESDSGVYVCTVTDGRHVSVNEAQIVVEGAEAGGGVGGGGGGGSQGDEDGSDVGGSLVYQDVTRSL